MKKIIFVLNVFLIIILNLKNNLKAFEPVPNESIFYDLIEDADPQTFLDYSSLNITEEQFLEIKEVALSYSQDKNEISFIARSCFDYITKNIKYANGDNNAYSVFKNKQGICYGFANLFKAMMNAIGVPCLVINGDTSFGAHSWNTFYLEGEGWLMCDPTNGVWTDHHFQNYFPLNIEVPLWKEGNYTYIFNQGLGISINNTTDSLVTIPESSRGNYISTLILENKENTYLHKLILNSRINNIVGNFDAFKNLTYLEASNNLYFENQDGCLLQRSKNNLIIPKYIQTITLSVTSLSKNMIYNLPNLTTLILLNCQSVSSYAIENCPNLTSIEFKEKDITFEDDAIINCAPSLTMIGYLDTNIESYANKYNIKFQSISNTQEKNPEEIVDKPSSSCLNITSFVVSIITSLSLLIILINKD